MVVVNVTTPFKERYYNVYAFPGGTGSYINTKMVGPFLRDPAIIDRKTQKIKKGKVHVLCII